MKTTTLAQAYKDAIQYIIWPQNHVVRITEDGESVWRSKETMVLHVSNPNKDLKRLIDYYPLGPQAMEQYVDEVMGTDIRLTKGTSDDFCYTYHERLMQYSVSDKIIDQITEIVNKLNNSPVTRRACATTWKPYDDNYVNTRSPPCLQWIKCEIVDGKLDMYTLWRSRDMLLGLGANIYALNRLHNHIANSCNVEVGFYEDINVDPHIYFKRDANYLNRWLQ